MKGLDAVLGECFALQGGIGCNVGGWDALDVAVAVRKPSAFGLISFQGTWRRVAGQRVEVWPGVVGVRVM